jgi:hypothetical protein
MRAALQCIHHKIRHSPQDNYNPGHPVYDHKNRSLALGVENPAVEGKCTELYECKCDYLDKLEGFEQLD